jgi:hypothetical protein
MRPHQARPDLVGLQGVTIWRSQTPADFVPGNSEHVEYDFLTAPAATRTC